jgi:hypothetical protein
MKVGRRRFMAAAAAASAACTLRDPPIAEPQTPVVDFHVHLFGVGDGGTGCHLSGAQRKRWNYPFFLKLLGLSENGRMDQDYVRELVRQLRGSSIRRAVLLAQDARYDGRGRIDLDSTHFYVPNEYLFEVVAAHPDLFVAGASLNPARADAIEALDRCAAAGARVLKIHPPTQDVDPADPRHRPFYRRVAEHGILLMAHTGSEHASEVTDHRLTDPARLVPALEQGCTVIAAHAGMGSVLERKVLRDVYFRHLVELIGRFPNLYCDTAALGSMFRWRNIPRLLEEPAVVDRLVHASDWPFTSNALVHWPRLTPRRLIRLSTETNLFERDYQLKRALGLPRAVFERGVRLLAATAVASARATG